MTSRASMQYLAGFREAMWERFAGLFLPTEGESTLVVPELSRAGAEHVVRDVNVLSYSDSEGPLQCIKSALSGFRAGGCISVEETLTLADWERLVSIGHFSHANASPVLSAMRTTKDDEEVTLIREACAAVEKGLFDLLDTVRPGVSELELASLLKDRIIAAGGESIPFCLVQSGVNASIPHMEPTKRRIAAGEIVVVDVGCTIQGYNSDVTRIFCTGTLALEQKLVLELVMEAQENAIALVAPGVKAMDIDEAARACIRNAGLGENFVHRTGHGLGLDVHEEPYIHGNNSAMLREGVVFTVEPGVYLPGRFGVRVEDDVLVTNTGCELLTKSPKVVA